MKTYIEFIPPADEKKKNHELIRETYGVYLFGLFYHRSKIFCLKMSKYSVHVFQYIYACICTIISQKYYQFTCCTLCLAYWKSIIWWNHGNRNENMFIGKYIAFILYFVLFAFARLFYEGIWNCIDLNLMLINVHVQHNNNNNINNFVFLLWERKFSQIFCHLSFYSCCRFLNCAKCSYALSEIDTFAIFVMKERRLQGYNYWMLHINLQWIIIIIIVCRIVDVGNICQTWNINLFFAILVSASTIWYIFLVISSPFTKTETFIYLGINIRLISISFYFFWTTTQVISEFISQ